MLFFRTVWIALIVTLCIILHALFVSPKGLKEYIKRKNLYTELSERHRKAMSHNMELYEKIKRFSESTEFREYVIREKLGWTKPGERIIVIRSEKEKPARKDRGGKK